MTKTKQIKSDTISYPASVYICKGEEGESKREGEERVEERRIESRREKEVRKECFHLSARRIQHHVVRTQKQQQVNANCSPHYPGNHGVTVTTAS